MRATLFLIPLALSSTACSSPAEMEKATGVETPAANLQRAAAPAAKPAQFEDNDERDGGSRDFSYAWPAAVAAHPALASQLAAERDRILADEKAEWAAGLADSPADCVPCRTRTFAKQWAVVADTPGFLSLSGDFATYTGGAHGMYGLESLVWDKAMRRGVSGAGMFRSADALDAALGSRLCAALNRQREEKRGEPVPPPDADDIGFNSCQSVADATVLIGSSTGKAFDRIGIWFGPYVAGPYAEGAYELDFPVDAAVLRAVKPEYAGAFAVKR
jgi:hypothetical protein